MGSVNVLCNIYISVMHQAEMMASFRYTSTAFINYTTTTADLCINISEEASHEISHVSIIASFNTYVFLSRCDGRVVLK